MSRDRTAPQLAADLAPHSGYAVLLELLFDSGALRLCLGSWPIVVGADTYVATGPLVSIQEHSEAADGTDGLQVTMTGLDPAVVTLVVSEPYRGRLARVLEQRFDADHIAVGSPTVEFPGRMVSMTSSESPDDRTHTVVLQLEHFDAEARRAVDIRFSDAEQRRRYPSDKGAEYVTSLTERVLARKPKA